MSTKIISYQAALIAGLLLFLLVLPLQTQAISGQINWHSFEKGLLEAEKQNKKIFLYFHADWCKYCEKMSSSTFKNAQVLDVLNKKFISIQIDSEKQNEIASKFGVRGLPSAWFLEKDATRITTLPGYVEGPVFAIVLKYIETNSFKKMNFQDFTKTL